METKYVTKAEYQVEKDAKNVAYAFILAKGFFTEFMDYLREIAKTQDPMDVCRQLMCSEYEKTQR